MKGVTWFSEDACQDSLTAGRNWEPKAWRLTRKAPSLGFVDVVPPEGVEPMGVQGPVSASAPASGACIHARAKANRHILAVSG